MTTSKLNIVMYNSMIVILLRLLCDDKPLKFLAKNYHGNFGEVLTLTQELHALFPEIQCSKLKMKLGDNINNVELSLPVERRRYLLRSLQAYMKSYTADKLRSDTINIPVWQTQITNFINFAKDTHMDNCIIKDMEYMHVLLYGVIENLVTINHISLDFNFNVHDNRGCNIFNFHNPVDPWNDDFIRCNIRADVTKLFEKYRYTKPNRPTVQNKTKTQKLEDIPTLKLFLEYALKKLNNGEYSITTSELNDLRVRPQRRQTKQNDDKMAINVSNRVSKIRPAFKLLSNSQNNLFEAEKYDNEFTSNYEIVASQEMIETVLERIKAEKLG